MEKVKKVVFAVDKDSFDSPDHTGVNIKVFSQIEQMKSYGAEVVLEKYRWENGNLNLNVNSDTDVFYFRRMESSVKLLHKLKEIKSKCKDVKIVMEIPTYPFKGEAGKSSIKRKINNIISDRFLHKYVDLVVVCSPSTPLKEFLHIPVVVFKNGVDFDKVSLNPECNADEINLICVSGCTFSHGYDRIIRGIKNYYDNPENKTVVNLHIVGTGEYQNYYKELSDEFGLTDKHIFIYGKKTGKELDEIYEKCNVALGHMATYRIGITYSSALKIREYAAHGLPIVSAPLLDVDNEDTKNYLLKIDDNPEDVDVARIVDFAVKVYSQKDVNKRIREVFEPYCDWKYVYKDVLKRIFD